MDKAIEFGRYLILDYYSIKQLSTIAIFVIYRLNYPILLLLLNYI